MASAESEPHDIIVIDDDTDAETVALHSPSQELWRKRRHTDYSFSEYEALFDDPTLPDASAPTAVQPLKKCKTASLTATCQAHMAKPNPAARFYVRHPHKKIPLVGPPGSRGDLKRISYFTKSLKNHQELTQRKCLEIS
ncbi:hypothetical protein I7I51_03865 [Histoplasma capsulatum]|uniref:Uncharacterized protein n=1 Tax=Ajellomyces capsulatus TaxID=5037 RepID=A0A8A1M5E5_AJECA|nr:hypothetical protein I7I51_03865 [Histoplasma capsulatum]